MAMVSEDAVRARAYQLWEEGGRIDGSHEEHWRRAEAECAAAVDGVDGGTPRARMGGASADGAGAAAPSGIDGEISRPLVDVKRKPRRWPTPIIDV